MLDFTFGSWKERKDSLCRGSALVRAGSHKTTGSVGGISVSAGFLGHEALLLL